VVALLGVLLQSWPSWTLRQTCLVLAIIIPNEKRKTYKALGEPSCTSTAVISVFAMVMWLVVVVVVKFLLLVLWLWWSWALCRVGVVLVIINKMR
jgi:hypothetical protein